ncbi:MAG: DUF3883 domain-containing protein [Bacteroidetes bacterium]|nr:DUF3883 domain-containing protein [Bacteroidota bacterium]
MRKSFDKIKLSQLHIFCKTLADAEIRNVSNIKRKYLERASSFDQTLSFLEDLNIIKSKNDELIPSKSFSLIHDSLDEFKKKFLRVLFSANGHIADELKRFLLNFQTENDKTFFKATELQKIKFSDIRNLLLELEFISASADNTTYLINPDFADLFVKQLTRQKFSPESLKKKQTENESVGLSAENAVIQYELKRLASILVLPNEIEHTSLDNVLAGYDIKSFEDCLDSNSKRIDRFIEVKAVSVDDYKFFWSKTEMQIAKVFGEKYFLYLLPVGVNNTFEFDKMIIKRNPFKSVYSNQQEWKLEEEILSFSKNIDG